MISAFSDYLELHICELLIIGALFLGTTLGLWVGMALGKNDLRGAE